MFSHTVTLYLDYLFFRYFQYAFHSDVFSIRRKSTEEIHTILYVLGQTLSLDKQTVCTVQSAPSSMERHLMWARFMVDLNIGRITEKISLLLCETLVFRNMVLM